MEIQQLKYYLQLCESKNYAEAAQSLFISQQALRKSIKKLEDELDLTLIYRKGNSLCLTPAGECVRSYASTLMIHAGRMEASLEAYREDSSYSEISVAMANGCYDRVAKIAIEPFKVANPNINVRVYEMPDIACEGYVLSGAADFAFCFGPSDTNIFEVEEIVRYPLYALVDKGHPLANREFLTLLDFQGELLGIADERYRIYYNFTYACRKMGFDPNIDFWGADPYATISYSQITGNISITVGEYIGQLLLDNQVAIPIRADGVCSEFDLIVKKGQSLNRNARKFIDYCIEQLRTGYETASNGGGLKAPLT
ncbi:MAG: LysR substrate-binding domain-containing protein [Coriobacteriales bacterium]|jgi:DNA-binding transcriptional LysR family regulator